MRATTLLPLDTNTCPSDRGSARTVAYMKSETASSLPAAAVPRPHTRSPPSLTTSNPNSGCSTCRIGHTVVIIHRSHTAQYAPGSQRKPVSQC